MKNINELGRRDFLKLLGVGSAAALLPSCTKKGEKFSTSVDPFSEEELGEMTYRHNPSTGDNVSILGYGCMRWPLLENPEPGKSVVDQEQVNKLIDYAFEHGVNYFDTAPVYCQGWSETATGIALKRHPRDKYFIATKLSNVRDYTFEGALKMYNRSFEALQTEYIDYYLLHSVGGGNGMETLNKRFFDNGVLDFLLKEREKGKIRNLGFSYHGDVAVFDYLLSIHDKVKWDFVQIQMNYLDWKHAKTINPSNTNAEYLYSELEKRGIPVVIMEPLLGGRLANVPQHVAEHFVERAPGRSIASWAFRFVGSHPGVLCALSGMTYMEHLQDNLRTFSPLEQLTEDDFAYLDQISDVLSKHPTIPCVDCKYCMPCPYGLDIPGIFLHYNKCVNEGDIIADKSDDNYKKARRAFLVGYDRSVPKLRQADHCIKCGECVSACPQRIRIPREMEKIHQYVESLKRGL